MVVFMIFLMFVICFLGYFWIMEMDVLNKTLEMHKANQKACIDRGGIPVMDERTPGKMKDCKFPEDFCKGQKQ